MTSNTSDKPCPKEHIKIDDTLIFNVDEYRTGELQAMDGQVQFMTDTGVHMVYLSGYKSRNDFIPFKQVIAKVDLKQPHSSLKHAPYSGHFIIFNDVPVNGHTSEQQDA